MTYRPSNYSLPASAETFRFIVDSDGKEEWGCGIAVLYKEGVEIGALSLQAVFHESTHPAPNSEDESAYSIRLFCQSNDYLIQFGQRSTESPPFLLRWLLPAHRFMCVDQLHHLSASPYQKMHYAMLADAYQALHEQLRADGIEIRQYDWRGWKWD